MDIFISTCKQYIEVESQIKEICNTAPDCRVIATCLPACASINRNFCLLNAESEIFIMLDDDIQGFYKGWANDLIMPMLENKNILLLGARLINKQGKHQMGSTNNDMPLIKADNDRIATAVLAIRKTVIENGIMFDENFKGSGYEDTAFCNDVKLKFGTGKMYINNKCKLEHINEMKMQGGKFWKHNHEYYMKKYPWDKAIVNQKEWGGAKSEELYK